MPWNLVQEFYFVNQTMQVWNIMYIRGYHVTYVEFKTLYFITSWKTIRHQKTLYKILSQELQKTWKNRAEILASGSL